MDISCPFVQTLFPLQKTFHPSMRSTHMPSTGSQNRAEVRLFAGLARQGQQEAIGTLNRSHQHPATYPALPSQAASLGLRLIHLEPRHTLQQPRFAEKKQPTAAGVERKNRFAW